MKKNRLFDSKDYNRVVDAMADLIAGLKLPSEGSSGITKAAIAGYSAQVRALKLTERLEAAEQSAADFWLELEKASGSMKFRAPWDDAQAKTADPSTYNKNGL